MNIMFEDDQRVEYIISLFYSKNFTEDVKSLAENKFFSYKFGE
ncbi:hypothetical protein Xekj_00963 [Xenorhabdus sp. KJ12.1]|nr:hypothetical protein Xekj_00963 [Xenorhabdus sp. KJ12.1]